LELHGEESFKQIFAMAAAGTRLEGAALVLTVIPARIRCRCGHEGPAGEGVDHHLDMPIAECPKCGTVCRVEGGRGVEGIDLQVEDIPVKKP
jgi:Zn finger protein HypA/HybF involved in hydrogenase expression